MTSAQPTEIKNACRRLSNSPVPLFVHRIVASERYNVGLQEIEQYWGLGDIADAHRMLDHFAEVEKIHSDEIDDASNAGTSHNFPKGLT